MVTVQKIQFIFAFYRYISTKIGLLNQLTLKQKLVGEGEGETEIRGTQFLLTHFAAEVKQYFESGSLGERIRATVTKINGPIVE
jgi:hypothetical protein